MRGHFPDKRELAEGVALLAVLAAIALLLDGTLAFVLTLVAFVVWIVVLSRSRTPPDVTGWSPGERRGLFIAQIAPAVVGLVVAEQLVDSDWYAFVAVAIALPLMFLSRALFARWRGARVAS